MISEKVKIYCCEDPSLIENYDKAIANTTQTWDCHHRLETDELISKDTLIATNAYYNRPADELILLTKSEHTTLHNKLTQPHNKWSDEAKQKRSEKYSGEGNPMYGKNAFANKSDEEMNIIRDNMSKSRKKYFDNGGIGPMTGKKHKPETIEKLREASIGNTYTLGKHWKCSEEHKKKVSNFHKLGHWWTNGIDLKFAIDCPGEGFIRGKKRFKL